MSKRNYHIINMDTWERKMHCSIFRNSFDPHYCVSFNLDITTFYHEVKKQGLPFSLTLIYEVAKCANQIENFRYRFKDGEVVLYDRIGTSFTHLGKGEDLFKQINVDMQDSLEKYISEAQMAISSQNVYFTAPPGNDVFIFSAIPWISFNNISHTYSGNKDGASPMFDWGKFIREENRIILPFSVQVHHSFVDGIHIGKFAELLQARLNQAINITY